MWCLNLDVCPKRDRFTRWVMGFSWVQIIVPVPWPVSKPTWNPWVYPYLCRSLHVIHNQFAIQHSPSNWKKSKRVSKVLGLGTWEWLGEKISSHVLSRTINKLNRAIFDGIADEMPPDIDVFSLGMKLPLQMSECDSGLVIWVKNNRVFEWSKDFTKKAPEPNKFLSCVCGSYIFCFGCWWSDEFLFLQTPWNGSPINQNYVPRDCPPMFLHGTIGISEPLQTSIFASSIN